MPLSSFGGRRKPVLCFVDDDKEERHRFEDAMEAAFTCVTAETFEACKQKLNDANLKPALWVLDLYFPSPEHAPSSEQKRDMLAKYADLEQKTRDFQAYLKSIGQGTEGGLDLLQKCRRDYRAPAVMFTRKGTLDNALDCIDAGAAAVLKKPMSSKLAGSIHDKESQLNQAMTNKAVYLKDKFQEVIDSNSFWNRHKG
jgi:DNA-binding NtrC family response regulator